MRILAALQPTDAVLVLAGVIVTTLYNIYKQHRDDVNAQRLSAGSVDTSDAEVVFQAMKDHLGRLEANLAEVSKEAAQWRNEADAQRLKAIENQQRADSLSRHVADLEVELQSLRDKLGAEEVRRATRRKPTT